jgi:hypothetical protein
MTPFEEELKKALSRQEPSADFTERLLTRVAEADANKKVNFWRTLWSAPTWRLGVATTAVALLMLAGGGVYQQHEHEVKGMAAKRQLLLAMQITGDKLQRIQEQVKESTQETQ